jgi:hypothetical protein
MEGIMHILIKLHPVENQTSKNNAPVDFICPLINLEVSTSTVDTSTYLKIYKVLSLLSRLRKDITAEHNIFLSFHY